MSNKSMEFEAFLQGWLVRQEHYLDELLTAKQSCHDSPDDALNDLVSRILNHYQQYYEEKSRVAEDNIFLVFSPTWFSSFERTFLWIAGFKPGLALRVLEHSVDDLSEDQRKQVNGLMQQTKTEERMLNNELARIQESLASPSLLQLVRRPGARDGEVVTAEEETVGRLRAEMEAVAGRANLLRMNTVSKIVEILNPVQNVKFLTEVTRLQLKVRNWGLERDADREGSSSD